MDIFSSDMLDSFRHQCVLMERRRVPDGLGGWTTTWADALEFEGIFGVDTSTEALVAEKQGLTSVYRVYVLKNVDMHYHDVFRRLDDGEVFRVTHDGRDTKTPNDSQINWKKLIAERWELPSNE